MAWYIQEQEKAYFDYNATTPIDKDVEQSIVNAFRIWGNPSSSNEIGKSLAAFASMHYKKKGKKKNSLFFNLFC